MAMNLGSSAGSMSDINVTPMVDVMLVLLIIFMVTAPMLQQGIALDLPQTRSATLDVNSDTMVVALSAQKRVFIGETEVPLTQLRAKLVGNLKLRQDKEVYLRADRTLPYGFVVDVMAILKDAGVVTLGMVTDPAP